MHTYIHTYTYVQFNYNYAHHMLHVWSHSCHMHITCNVPNMIISFTKFNLFDNCYCRFVMMVRLLFLKLGLEYFGHSENKEVITITSTHLKSRYRLKLLILKQTAPLIYVLILFFPQRSVSNAIDCSEEDYINQLGLTVQSVDGGDREDDESVSSDGRRRRRSMSPLKRRKRSIRKRQAPEAVEEVTDVMIVRR